MVSASCVVEDGQVSMVRFSLVREVYLLIAFLFATTLRTMR
jgi:hypothetical protein